tara:strand:+ start:1373 stop:2665 length:1293 start_codon:yes stop_codon:yes gene_type:complete
MNIDTKQNNRQKRSLSIILALAVISLLAGASVSTSVDNLVEPRYAEDSPYAGIIDDAVGDATWKQLENNEKGLKGKLKSFLSDRIDISDEDREKHLQERVEANRILTTALQFCIDNVDCDADSEVLTSMLFSMDTRAKPMMKEVNLDMQDWEEKKAYWQDNYPGWEEKKADWEEKKADWEAEYPDWEEKRGNGEAPLNFESKEKEMKTSYKHHEWKDFGEKELTDKMSMVENGAIAISYCISHTDCAGLATTHDDRRTFNSILNKIGEEMANRHADYQECYEGDDCKREGKKDQREDKGLISRLSENFQRDDLDREDLDRTDYKKFDVTQEMCESRLGEWIVEDDKSYCDWSMKEDCSDPVCSDGERRASSDGCNECICDSGIWSCTEMACENSDEDREESEQDTDDANSSKESCEESGGTWSEDRQVCY